MELKWGRVLMKKGKISCRLRRSFGEVFYYFYCTFLVLLPTIHSLLCTYIHTLQFVVLGMVEFAEHSIDVRGSISASAMIRRDDVVGRHIVINL